MKITGDQMLVKNKQVDRSGYDPAPCPSFSRTSVRGYGAEQSNGIQPGC